MNVYAARQPIFDRYQKVFGYELLSRRGPHNFFDRQDRDQATSELITNSFLLMDVNSLTRGRRAFLNFTENLIIDEIPTLFEPDTIAVEISELATPSTALLEACERLKKLDYLLVLDDFLYQDSHRTLLELASVIKIDVLSATDSDLNWLRDRVNLRRTQLLAKRVESFDQYEQALKLGYAFFQGFFFSKPTMLTGQTQQGHKLSYLHVLQEVSRPEPDFEAISQIIERDLSLLYKILRLANSAAFARRSRVRNVREALVFFGLNETRKWITVLVTAKAGQDKPDELQRSAVVRARFFEVLASSMRMQQRSSEMFIMGMLSLMDAFFGRPLADILHEITVAEDVKEALLDRQGRLGPLYELLLSYETGNWTEVDRLAQQLHLTPEVIAKTYYDAITWTEHLMANLR